MNNAIFKQNRKNFYSLPDNMHFFIAYTSGVVALKYTNHCIHFFGFLFHSCICYILHQFCFIFTLYFVFLSYQTYFVLFVLVLILFSNTINKSLFFFVSSRSANQCCEQNIHFDFSLFLISLSRDSNADPPRDQPKIVPMCHMLTFSLTFVCSF